MRFNISLYTVNISLSRPYWFRCIYIFIVTTSLYATAAGIMVGGDREVHAGNPRPPSGCCQTFQFTRESQHELDLSSQRPHCWKTSGSFRCERALTDWATKPPPSLYWGTYFRYWLTVFLSVHDVLVVKRSDVGLNPLRRAIYIDNDKFKAPK